MTIELPYPHKALWPNGRAHWGTRASETKKHKRWAFEAALAAFGPYQRLFPERVRFVVTVYPKPKGPLPDKDNTSAAMKAYLDGVAAAIGVNDRRFDEPRIQFGERCALGKVVLTLDTEARSIGEIIQPIVERVTEQQRDEAA